MKSAPVFCSLQISTISRVSRQSSSLRIDGASSQRSRGFQLFTVVALQPQLLGDLRVAPARASRGCAPRRRRIGIGQRARIGDQGRGRRHGGANLATPRAPIGAPAGWRMRFYNLARLRRGRPSVPVVAVNARTPPPTDLRDRHRHGHQEQVLPRLRGGQHDQRRAHDHARDDRRDRRDLQRRDLHAAHQHRAHVGLQPRAALQRLWQTSSRSRRRPTTSRSAARPRSAWRSTARSTATTSWSALADKDQKPFPSVELTDNYAGTSKVGLIGLAFTDTPREHRHPGAAVLAHRARLGVRAPRPTATALEFEASTGRRQGHRRRDQGRLRGRRRHVHGQRAQGRAEAEGRAASRPPTTTTLAKFATAIGDQAGNFARRGDEAGHRRADGDRCSLHRARDPARVDRGAERLLASARRWRRRGRRPDRLLTRTPSDLPTPEIREAPHHAPDHPDQARRLHPADRQAERRRQSRPQFAVAPAVAQTLRGKLKLSSEFLGNINIIPVVAQEGDKVGVGVKGTIASRTDTARARSRAALPRRPRRAPLPLREDRLRHARPLRDARRLGAPARIPGADPRRDRQAPRRSTSSRSASTARTVAVETDPVANPLLQDVNKGWLQHIREDAPTRVLADGDVEPATDAGVVTTKGDLRRRRARSATTSTTSTSTRWSTTRSSCSTRTTARTPTWS